MTDDGTLRVHNEFAAVALRVTPHGRGTRLEIRAGRTGAVGYVDATVLESLISLSESQLMEIVAMATVGQSGTE